MLEFYNPDPEAMVYTSFNTPLEMLVVVADGFVTYFTLDFQYSIGDASSRGISHLKTTN